MSIKHLIKNISRREGLTLPELLIATFILTVTFAGVIIVFFRCMELSEMAGNSSTAVYASKSRIADIENTPFSQIYSTYNNTTFTAAGLDGVGVTYVNNANPELLEVTTAFCWKQKNGRIIGEDTNLNGQLNSGEDQNANGILDSPVKLTTSIFDIGA